MKQSKLSFFSLWSRFILWFSLWRCKDACLPSPDVWEPYLGYRGEWDEWVQSQLFELHTGQMGFVLVVAPAKKGSPVCVRIHTYINASIHRSGTYIYTSLRSLAMLTAYENKRGVYEFVSNSLFKRRGIFCSVIAPLMPFLSKTPITHWKKVRRHHAAQKIHPKNINLEEMYAIYWVPLP